MEILTVCFWLLCRVPPNEPRLLMELPRINRCVVKFETVGQFFNLKALVLPACCLEVLFERK